MRYANHAPASGESQVNADPTDAYARSLTSRRCPLSRPRADIEAHQKNKPRRSGGVMITALYQMAACCFLSRRDACCLTACCVPSRLDACRLMSCCVLRRVDACFALLFSAAMIATMRTQAVVGDTWS